MMMVLFTQFVGILITTVRFYIIHWIVVDDFVGRLVLVVDSNTVVISIVFHSM